MTVTHEGTRIYAHNATDAFSRGDQPTKDMLERISDVHADVFFITEAYDATKDTIHIENVAEDLDNAGYRVNYGRYSEQTRKDQHGYIIGVREGLLVGGFTTVALATGRLLVQAAVVEQSSGREFLYVGGHFGDHKAARTAEVGSFLDLYRARLDARQPLVLSGDINNAVDYTFFRAALWLGGTAAQLVFAEKARKQETGERQSAIGRVSSLAIRAKGQLDGADIKRLRDEGYLFDANNDHVATSFVPGLGPLEKVVERIPALRAWLLKQPHIEADHIMANIGMFVDFRTYQALANDEHLGIAATYQLVRYMNHSAGRIA